MQTLADNLKPEDAVEGVVVIVKDPATSETIFGRRDGTTGVYGALYICGIPNPLPILYDEDMEPGKCYVERRRCFDA